MTFCFNDWLRSNKSFFSFNNLHTCKLSLLKETCWNVFFYNRNLKWKLNFHLLRHQRCYFFIFTPSKGLFLNCLDFSIKRCLPLNIPGTAILSNHPNVIFAPSLSPMWRYAFKAVNVYANIIIKESKYFEVIRLWWRCDEEILFCVRK